MQKQECTLEIFSEGRWRSAATLVLTGKSELGCKTSTALIYLDEYALNYLGRADAHALSATTPVLFDLKNWRTWPAFLVDLLPQGYGRQELARRLEISADTPASDWKLLCHGGGNPIGNLRIAQAAADLQQRDGARGGFTEEEVIARSGDFIEYLASEGFYVAGSSGIQGEWPKVLLTQDAAGLWHLDHLLADEDARRHCLVKFTKNDKPVFEQILQLERIYYDVARDLGLKVHHAPLEFKGSALFIDRFDRQCVDGKVLRHGQESLLSLTEKAGFDVTVSHDEACAAIAKYCTDPVADLIEYVLRDVTNIALGNKDNHGRNTAFQRTADGRVCITPLYDFAPMFLHPAGVARRIRWKENDAGAPEWAAVAVQAAGYLKENPVEPLLAALADFAPKLAAVPKLMEDYGVPENIRSMLQKGIEANVDRLIGCQHLRTLNNGQAIQTFTPK